MSLIFVKDIDNIQEIVLHTLKHDIRPFEEESIDLLHLKVENFLIVHIEVFLGLLPRISSLLVFPCIKHTLTLNVPFISFSREIELVSLAWVFHDDLSIFVHIVLPFILIILIVEIFNDSYGDIVDNENIWLNWVWKLDDELLILCRNNLDLLVEFVACHKVEVFLVHVVAYVSYDFAIELMK
jgi:hypothetical protein